MRLKARLAQGLIDTVRRLPRRWTGPVSTGVGGLLFLAHDRRYALANIRRVYPDWSVTRRWRTVYGAYRQIARAVVEVLHTARYDDREIEERVALENLVALADAHALGRGVILLTGHFGNWEWAGRRVSIAGFPFAALYKEPKDAGLAERLRRVRREAGLEVIDHDDARGALAWLKRGGVLAILVDQEPKRAEDGVEAPLFGRPTRTHRGPFRLARKAGAPVVTSFCRRVEGGRYRARLEPFPLSDAPEPERAIERDAANFNARLEAAVHENPDHWLWMYRRWKRIDRHKDDGPHTTLAAVSETAKPSGAGSDQ